MRTTACPRDLHEQVRGVAFWRPANKVRSERQSGCECHGGTFSGGWERLRAASEFCHEKRSLARPTHHRLPTPMLEAATNIRQE